MAGTNHGGRHEQEGNVGIGYRCRGYVDLLGVSILFVTRG